MDKEIIDKMENQEELTFIYTPVNDTFPLAVLITANEELGVSEIKKILLKIFGNNDYCVNEANVILSRILLLQCSEDKRFSLLGDLEIIKGIKAMDKFVYAFEVSSGSHTSKCILCQKMCDCELKKHVGKNCLFIMCNLCMKAYFKIPSKTYECPVCHESVPELSFIKIGESMPTISIVNVSLLLNELNSDKSYDELNIKFGDPRLINVPLTGKVDNLTQKGGYVIHFIHEKNHDCIASKCVYQEDSTVCDPPESQKEVEQENVCADVDDIKTPKIEQENVCADVDDIKTPKIEQATDKSDFQKQIPSLNDAFPVINPSNEFKHVQHSKQLFEDVKFDNMVKQFQHQREKTLNFYKEHSRKIVIEGLQNLAQEFDVFTRSVAKNRPPRSLNPFENLKFSGKNDFVHPVRFIQDFEFFADRERLNDYEQQFFFGQSLTEGAANWLKVRGYGRTFPQMKESFLNFFWGEDDQNRLRLLLKFGKYNKDSGLSMSDYFYKYAIQANYLDTVPEEETVTGWLTEHFDIMIRAKMYGNHVKNVDEALRSLKNLEMTDKNGSKEPDEKSQKLKKPENEGPNNFFSSSFSKKIPAGTWTDCFGTRYEGIKKDGNYYHRNVTDRIWALHSLSYNNHQSQIQHFDVSCDEASSKFLTNVPCKLHHISIDINGDPVKYQILGPITVAKQKYNQLIVSTCPSFKTNNNLISGQLVYIGNDESFRPYSIITCSIPEDSEFRYILPNSNEQIACMTCKDKIEEVQFRENRTIAVGDLSVRYFEQSFKKKRHILRFLNEIFCVVYSVWDDAVSEYNPLEPTYH